VRRVTVSRTSPNPVTLRLLLNDMERHARGSLDQPLGLGVPLRLDLIVDAETRPILADVTQT